MERHSAAAEAAACVVQSEAAVAAAQHAAPLAGEPAIAVVAFSVLLLLLLLLLLLRGRFRLGCVGDSWRLPAFAVGNPNVVNRMFDRVQARARGEHPAGKDALDLTLQRHLVDLHESIRVRRLGRRPRVAHTRRHLQRTELHRLIDRNIERNDAAGDLVETGEHCRWIDNALRRRFDDHRVARLRRRVRRLRRVARRIGTRRQSRRRLTRRDGGALRRLTGWRRGRQHSAGWWGQFLRLDGAASRTVRWRQVHRRGKRLRGWRIATPARVIRLLLLRLSRWRRRR